MAKNPSLSWMPSRLSLAAPAIVLVLAACGGGGGGSTPTPTPATYTVTYSGNTNSGGAVPSDANTYTSGQSVTVLGNTGSLVKTGYSFTGWNTVANGTGTTYTQGQSFTMGSSNVTLAALWTAVATSTSEWTWVTGTSTVTLSETAAYGTQGVAASGNTPGGRYAPASCTDGSGNFWMFGGWGYDSTGAGAYLGDLWKFDGANWAWVSGAKLGAQPGVYGNKGAGAAGDAPGARYGASAWAGKDGSIWVFGGSGYDSAGTHDYLNDLWKFDGTKWTWVSGSNLVDGPASYGSLGVAAASNVPGWRRDAAAWTDKAGNLWLFGGEGADSSAHAHYLNDLWKFDGTNWTWMGGSSTGDKAGTYGTKGVAGAANVPGARNLAVATTDASGKAWLFGGAGYASVATALAVDLNDLWTFDGTNWTWVAGSNTDNQFGTYGTKGTAASANVPGGRWSPAAGVDSSGNFWLFGGAGESATSAGVWENDLWKFDGTNWTWVAGSNTGNAYGVYGTKGTAAAANTPGGRANGRGWMDSTGKLWIFGGEAYDSAGIWNYGLNDVWSFKP
jgi:N-acetylneuraminic acid mutarotase